MGQTVDKRGVEPSMKKTKINQRQKQKFNLFQFRRENITLKSWKINTSSALFSSLRGDILRNFNN